MFHVAICPKVADHAGLRSFRVRLHTLGEMGKMLNRSTVYLSGLQTRFELPVFDGAGYSDAHLALLRTLVYLRALFISEETLRDLWHLEKKLLHRSAARQKSGHFSGPLEAAANAC